MIMRTTTHKNDIFFQLTFQLIQNGRVFFATAPEPWNLFQHEKCRWANQKTAPFCRISRNFGGGTGFLYSMLNGRYNAGIRVHRLAIKEKDNNELIRIGIDFSRITFLLQ